MSRVHDALRKAAQENPQQPSTPAARQPLSNRTAETMAGLDPYASAGQVEVQAPLRTTALVEQPVESEDIETCIVNARVVEFNPLEDALLVNPVRPREAPAEEFRTLRTRLNHLQKAQPLHTLVITSPSPAEGKSFTAANLALTQSQLADKRILLADFDFRRPNIEKTFQLPISPGITNYLQGTASLSDILMRMEGTNMWVITAGDAVPNPLELLNLKECAELISGLRNHFDWVILDSPPLLFAADANLLATMCDGTVLVVRIGTTTYDSVARAVQSLCENNVLGIVVNGARRGELYSKYDYYYNNYGADLADAATSADEPIEVEKA
jgi:receptor protein-tyrosine kinase